MGKTCRVIAAGLRSLVGFLGCGTIHLKHCCKKTYNRLDNVNSCSLESRNISSDCVRSRERVTDSSTTAAPASTDTRVGAIDVGSNSIRLVVAEVLPSGGYRVLAEWGGRTRLGGA